MYLVSLHLIFISINSILYKYLPLSISSVIFVYRIEIEKDL